MNLIFLLKKVKKLLLFVISQTDKSFPYYSSEQNL